MLLQAIVGLLLAPSLVVAATLTSYRFGPRVGGVVSAFPAIVGPVLLIDALGHGPAFAAQAADATLLGLASLGAFALGYAHTARRGGWRASLGAGWAAAALGSLAIGAWARHSGSPIGLLVATATLIAAHRALPRNRAQVPRARLTPRREKGGRIAPRMAATAALVLSLSAASGALGPLTGGMLAALPVLASVLTVFTHREAGDVAAIELLRGTLAGMSGFVVFCAFVALGLGPYGIAPGFAGATAAAVVIQAAAFLLPLLQRLLAELAPGPGAHLGGSELELHPPGAGPSLKTG